MPPRCDDLPNLSKDKSVTEVERKALTRAIDLANASRHVRKGNPQVAAVLLSADGQVLSDGVHQGVGSDHAEVVAISKAGQDLAGATLCVSFEPCDHFGQTAPCTNAIIEAGISRVVFGAADRTKETSGAQRLRSAGISVVSPDTGDPLSVAAEGVVYRWQFAKLNARPWVTWKLATSVDSRVVDPMGQANWFTSKQSRNDVHDLRELVDAVVVGTGTAIADDPALTARDDVGGLRKAQPYRVVVGGRALPSNAKLIKSVWGAGEVVHLPRQSPSEVLANLYAMGVNHILLEAGPSLSSAFVDSGLVDEVIWFVAPVWFGGTHQAARVSPKHLASIEPVSVTDRDGDIRIHGRLRSQLVEMAA